MRKKGITKLDADEDLIYEVNNTAGTETIVEYLFLRSLGRLMKEQGSSG